MKLKSILAGAAFLATLTVSAGAFAAPGLTVSPAHMHAGPAGNYPLVASLPPNAHIDVGGCVNGGSWCDVNWNGVHGWVSGRHLEVFRHHHPVAIVSAGPIIPVIVFNQEDYWGHYYHDRPWYGNHPDWHHDHDYNHGPDHGAPQPDYNHGPGPGGTGPGPGGPGGPGPGDHWHGQ